DNSKGKKQISEIKGINQQFSKLTDSSKGKTSQKCKLEIIEKYKNDISSFIENLANLNLEDCRAKY
ncbi:hypothetical protein, partial [Streptococcus pneumoniae]|uniref:hypothetical protein n=1 Tax=Streptococcus pneumoniae TaxID=1313 RepID=UPI0018B0CD4F